MTASPSTSTSAAAPRDHTDGLRLMAVGAFWFSIMSLLVKLAGRRLPSQELVLVRAVITLALSWASLRAAGLSVRGTHPRLLVLRGALGCAGLTCFYYSLVHLPLGEATIIQYTNPVFAAVMAAVVLRERVGAREVACLAVSLLGVVMVVRPAGLLGGAASALPSGAVAIALLGALFSAAAYVTVRRMGPAEDSRRVVFYPPLVTVPVTLPFALPGWVWPTPVEWLLLVGIGVTTQLAQVFMTRGLQRETAARATAVGYLQIVFAAAWGFVVFAERPGVWALAGGAVIVASTLALAHSAHAARRAAAAAATQDGTA